MWTSGAPIVAGGQGGQLGRGVGGQLGKGGLGRGCTVCTVANIILLMICSAVCTPLLKAFGPKWVVK